MEFPNTLEEIGWASFKGNKLESVMIPSSVTSIGDDAFSNNRIQTLVIKNDDNEYNLQSIGDYAFYNNRLTHVDLIVQSIGAYAFSKNVLTEIVFRSIVFDIGRYAFSHDKLRKVVFDVEYPYDDDPRAYGIDIISEGAFQYNESTELELPTSLITIEKHAFEHNELTELRLPTSLERIGDAAFTWNHIPFVPSLRGIEVHSLAFDDGTVRPEIHLDFDFKSFPEFQMDDCKLSYIRNFLKTICAHQHDDASYDTWEEDCTEEDVRNVLVFQIEGEKHFSCAKLDSVHGLVAHSIPITDIIAHSVPIRSDLLYRLHRLQILQTDPSGIVVPIETKRTLQVLPERCCIGENVVRVIKLRHLRNVNIEGQTYRVLIIDPDNQIEKPYDILYLKRAIFFRRNDRLLH